MADLQTKTSEFLTAELTQRFARLTEWLVSTKNISVTVDEVLQQFNANSGVVKSSVIQDIEPPKTVPGNVIIPLAKKKKAPASPAQDAQDTSQVSNAPTGEGCKVPGTRGDKKGKPCGAPVIPGTDTCKACAAKQKKAAAKAEDGKAAGKAAKPVASFAAVPEQSGTVEQDSEPYPLEGRDDVQKLVPQNYLVIQQGESIVCYGIHDTNGPRNLTDSEKTEAEKLLVVAPEGLSGIKKSEAPKLEAKPKPPKAEPEPVKVSEPVKEEPTPIVQVTPNPVVDTAPMPVVEPVAKPEAKKKPKKEEPSVELKPATEVPKPAVEVPKPAPVEAKPAVEVPKPVPVEVPKPAVEAPKPAPVEVPKPVLVEVKPAAKPEVPKPAAPKSIIPPSVISVPNVMGLPSNISKAKPVQGIVIPGLKMATK